MSSLDWLFVSPVLLAVALALWRGLRRGHRTSRLLARAAVGGGLGGALMALVLNLGTDPDLLGALPRCIIAGAAFGLGVGVLCALARAGVRARRMPRVPAD